jgi:hypothetical protein
MKRCKTQVPKFIREWAELDDVVQYMHEMRAATDDWEEVSSEIIEEDKYNNVEEVVLKHKETGRFFRLHFHTLPYGITDYGMRPEDENIIIEVFPYQVMVTKYMTTGEAVIRKNRRKK